MTSAPAVPKSTTPPVSTKVWKDRIRAQARRVSDYNGYDDGYIDTLIAEIPGVREAEKDLQHVFDIVQAWADTKIAELNAALEEQQSAQEVAAQNPPANLDNTPVERARDWAVSFTVNDRGALTANIPGLGKVRFDASAHNGVTFEEVVTTWERFAAGLIGIGAQPYTPPEAPRAPVKPPPPRNESVDPNTGQPEPHEQPMSNTGTSASSTRTVSKNAPAPGIKGSTPPVPGNSGNPPRTGRPQINTQAGPMAVGESRIVMAKGIKVTVSTKPGRGGGTFEAVTLNISFLVGEATGYVKIFKKAAINRFLEAAGISPEALNKTDEWQNINPVPIEVEIDTDDERRPSMKDSGEAFLRFVAVVTDEQG